MAKTTVDKIADLEYNELITLGVIEKEPDLTALLRADIELPFSMLYFLSKNNQLTIEHQAIIRSIFDFVILVKKELIQSYLRIADSKGETIKKIEETAEIASSQNSVVSTQTEELPKINEVIDAPKSKVAKPTKTSELPRRYGKEKIEKDIQAQGGKATPVQNAMLKVNNLKNIVVNLFERGKKDMLTGSQILSDADCRDIVAVVTIAERKLEEILKRK